MNRPDALASRRRYLGRSTIILDLPGNHRSRTTLLDAVRRLGRLRQRREYQHALRVADRLIRDGRARTEGRLLKMGVCLDLHRPREALRLARALQSDELVDPGGIGLLAQTLRSLGKSREAASILEDALVHFPGDIGLRELLAMMQLESGNRNAALENLREVLRLDPEHVKAYAVLAKLDELRASERERMANLPVTRANIIDLNFARAHLSRRRGDLDEEFRYLDRAHDAASQNGRPWDAARKNAEGRELIRIFGRDHLERIRARPQSAARPVFIVGVPRSGSTLIESLLCTDESVGTAGETELFEMTLLDRARGRSPEASWPCAIGALTPEELGKVGADYQARIAEIHTDSECFIDKKLENFLFVGVLSQIFPQARFIHALRHPLATILSSYQEYLINVQLSHSLTDLAHWYRLHLDVMNHWKSILPGRVHTVEYEALVRSPHREGRALFEFCGLDWRDEALDFAADSRTVQTASVLQVREPIHQRAAGRWLRYAGHLEPARRVLRL